jgi:uncharacterized membrane protein HdeD (DUF308 family)
VIQLISDKWWLFVVRGLLAIAFGIAAFARPDVALTALVTLYGFFALTDGLTSLAGCFLFTRTKFVWWMLLEGLFGVAAGILTFAMPGVTALVLLTLLGIWLIASGAVRIALAIEMRKAIDNEWLVGLAGVCSVVAGALTLLRPLQTAVGWMWVMGAYALIVGIVMLTLGINLRRLGGSISHDVQTA